MSVRERHSAVDGVLLIDKPVGPSSNVVLQRAKRLLGAARAGHTGTLDPLAGGLLVIGVGQATRFCGEMLEADKLYRARLKLGERTDTGDAEGAVLSRGEVRVTRDQLLAVLEQFRGEIEQIPPMYAAIKHHGRPLYSYARSGEKIARRSRRVVIRQLGLEEFESEHVILRVECSKGTYIRALAEDIGGVLGCGAHLAGLQRLAAGPFTLGDAIGMDALEALSQGARLKRLLPPEALLGSRPRLVLVEPAAAKFRQGQAVPVNSASGSVAVFGDKGVFIGAGEVDAQGLLRPRRLIAQYQA
jgi:tRNA pseudouridine55 synthase